jgi:hypothetical protein
VAIDSNRERDLIREALTCSRQLEGHDVKRILVKAILATIATGTAPAVLADVEVQTFAAGTPARAAEVNQNFTNVKNAIELAERRIEDLQERIAGLETSLQTLLALGEVLSVETFDGVTTVTLTGVNLQVLNGLGRTESVNGAGNLIIGYDEPNFLTDQSFCSLDRNDAGDLIEDGTACIAAGGEFGPIHKSGSHNLIVGSQNNYSSAGAIVAGKHSTSNALYASVLGGVRNRAGNSFATVLGGQENAALGNSSSVAGGNFNTTRGQHASVSGGRRNVASGSASSIAGGNQNVASGNTASITGGTENIAEGIFAVAVGGFRNNARANTSTILGGQSRTLDDNTGTIPSVTP